MRDRRFHAGTSAPAAITSILIVLDFCGPCPVLGAGRAVVDGQKENDCSRSREQKVSYAVLFRCLTPISRGSLVLRPQPAGPCESPKSTPILRSWEARETLNRHGPLGVQP